MHQVIRITTISRRTTIRRGNASDYKVGQIFHTGYKDVKEPIAKIDILN